MFLNGNPLFTDDSAIRISYERVLPLADGRFLVLGEAKPQLDSDMDEGFAKIIDSEGRILGKIDSAGGIASACQHPSGSLSILALEQPIKESEQNASYSYALVIKRLTPDFEPAQSIVWQDGLPEPYYQVAGSLEEAQKNGPYERSEPTSNNSRFTTTDRFGAMDVMCVGEETLLAINHYGQKLFRYDEKLGQTWAVTVGPFQTYTHRAFRSPPPLVSLLPDGDIVAAIEADNIAIHAYNHRFDTDLKALRNEGFGYDIIVKRYSRAGELRWQKVVGTPASERLNGLASAGDRLAFVEASN